MRDWRSLWRNVLPPHLLEELEVWIGVLIALGGLAMLYASLAGQPARASELPREVGAGTLLFKKAGGYDPAAPGERAVRRPRRGEVPATLTLPRRCGASRPARRARLRRLALGALLAGGVALLAAGYWLPAKAELAQELLNRAWASTAASAARPWPWADTWPVARLTLPGDREPLTVLAGASGRNLAFAPALMDGSAAPGAPGVSVIAGHRDTHFRALRELALGDEVVLERPDGARFTYEVAALDVVDSERAELRLDAHKSMVALVTCWPFDSVSVGGRWRYVVTA